MTKREEEVLRYYKKSDHFGKSNSKAVKFIQGFMPHLTNEEAKEMVLKFIADTDKEQHDRWDDYYKQVKKWRKCNGFY